MLHKSTPACWAWVRLLERSLEEEEESPATTGGCILHKAVLPLGRSEKQRLCKERNYYFKSGFRIRIRIGSVFAELLDPDPNSEQVPYGSP